MIQILFSGIGWTDIAFTLNRVAVGMSGAGPYSIDAEILSLIDHRLG
jgi:hypothetical protein